jgi:hypothetical protein
MLSMKPRLHLDSVITLSTSSQAGRDGLGPIDPALKSNHLTGGAAERCVVMISVSKCRYRRDGRLVSHAGNAESTG